MCIENYEAKARRNVYLSMEELSWGKGKPQAAAIVSFPAAVSIVSRDGLRFLQVTLLLYTDVLEHVCMCIYILIYVYMRNMCIYV